MTDHSYSNSARAYTDDIIDDATSSVWFAISHAFDAGAASVAPPTPQKPAWITTDDPRWRDGAKVRGEFRDGSAVEGTLEMSAAEGGDPPGGWWIVYLLDCSTWVTEFTTVYLLAEAPDDDEPILDALRVDGFVDAQLASLRAAGYDVVKRASA